MFELASHIEYLLTEHSCVVVPGMGAFLVHETPAVYDEREGLMMPPSRTLGFNQALTLNDGLLAQSVARRTGTTLEGAKLVIESGVEVYMRQLSLGATLPLGRLGHLSVQDGALVFMPSAATTVTLHYRGLQPLALKPLALNETKEECKASDFNILESCGTEAPHLSLSRVFRVAASIMVTVLLAGLFMMSHKFISGPAVDMASIDSGLIANAQSAARGNVCTQVHSAPAQEGIGQMNGNDDNEVLPVSRPIELNISLPRTSDETGADVEKDVAVSGDYMLVVGSFPSMKLALKHIGSDTRLRVAEMDGRFRIYAATAKSYAAASACVDSIRDEFPSVWICRK